MLRKKRRTQIVVKPVSCMGPVKLEFPDDQCLSDQPPPAGNFRNCLWETWWRSVELRLMWPRPRGRWFFFGFCHGFVEALGDVGLQWESSMSSFLGQTGRVKTVQMKEGKQVVEVQLGDGPSISLGVTALELLGDEDEEDEAGPVVHLFFGES